MKRVSNGKCESQHKTVKFILFLKTASTQQQQIKNKIKLNVFAVKPLYCQGGAFSASVVCSGFVLQQVCCQCFPLMQLCFPMPYKTTQSGRMYHCLKNIWEPQVCNFVPYDGITVNSSIRMYTCEMEVTASKILNFLLSCNCWYLQRENEPIVLLRMLIKWQTFIHQSWWRFLNITGPIIFLETAPCIPKTAVAQ